MSLFLSRIYVQLEFWKYAILFHNNFYIETQRNCLFYVLFSLYTVSMVYFYNEYWNKNIQESLYNLAHYSIIFGLTHFKDGAKICYILTKTWYI